MYQQIDISQNWKVFPLDLDEGLLGATRRAYQRHYVPEDFESTPVPKTSTAVWLESGRIEDPYVGMNSRNTTWMEQKEWWYLKDFDLPRTDGFYRLTFHGINYRAEAWLNDVQIGTWEGSFLTRKIDLDPELLLSQGNRLAVRVRTQERAWEDGTQTNPKGFQNSSAHIRTQRPTPQYAYGWNWSPHLIAAGIWRPVTLEWTNAARIEDFRVIANVDRQGKKGSLKVSADLHNLLPSKQSFELEISVRGPGKTRINKSISVNAFSGNKKVSEIINIPSPSLWWPNGYGKQPLYNISLHLKHKGSICDKKMVRRGFRHLRWIQNTNAHSVLKASGQTNRMWSIVGDPYPWTMEVNGRKIFSKGSNWCPVDNLYRDRDDHVRRQLELARDAHYVFLRVWGGGLTESDHFYDSCDELGILCLQEFWFACGSAPAMHYPVFMENAASEVTRLRDHTSLALWGGGNEFNPDNHENRPIIDRIHNLVNELDGVIEFRRGSPYKGDRHGGLVSTPYRTTNKYRDLLPGRKRLVLLRSECAVGRSPTRPENIKKFIPKEDRWPINWTVYQNHHAQKAEWKQVTQPFGKADSWEQELLHAGVFHCIDSRLNMEFARAHKYESSGCWTWQINASWPSFHREHIDWFGDPKPVYYWYKNACKPIISLADFERFVYAPGEPLGVHLYSVNDTYQKVNLVVYVRVISLDGKCVHSQTYDVSLPEDSVADLGALDWEIPEEWSESAFYLALQSTRGKQIIHRNTYYVAVSPDTHQQTAVPIGSDMKLAYMGNHYLVNAPHYYTLADIVDEPTEQDKETKEAEGDELKAVYSKSFTIPDSLKGKSIELYMPGVSADDTVYLNGHKVGATSIKCPREGNYEADPLRWPNLPNRHYPLPGESLNLNGQNELQIHLNGEKLKNTSDRRFGFSEMIYLREKSPKRVRDALHQYNNRMTFFEPITKGPRANVKVDIIKSSDTHYSISLQNTSSCSAAFVLLDIVEEKDARFTFDEAAFSAIHPGEVVSAELTTSATLPHSAKLRVSGLNFKEMRMKFSARRR